MERSLAEAHMAALRSVYDNTYEPSVIRTYQYWAKVESIIDGDTLDLSLELGFNLTIAARVRLLGINTPEVHGVKHGSAEHRRGVEATDFLKSILPDNNWVEAAIYLGKREKYGRWLAEIFHEGQSLNAQMLTAGHANLA